MAVKKKASTKKRKSRVGSSKSDSCKAVGSRKKIGEKTYKVAAYKSTKAQAQKVAENHRAKGKNKLARVAQVTCSGKKTYQVLTRG